ncbi:type II secretion system F family protein [bacterium]|nr:type II secretion system F family protein [bacterium]
MREFRYRALSAGGETVTGMRPAADVAALARDLTAQNLILLEGRPSLRLGGVSRVRRRDLLDFTLHMATSLGAGIPVIQALRDAEAGMAGQGFARIVKELREEISSGSQVAEAMSHHPDVFPELYLALVAAGESSGNLDGTLGELVRHLEWADDLSSKVKQALMYPALLATATLGLFLLMIIFVIPRFLEVFQELDYQLPTLTLRVLAVGSFFRHWWPFLLGGAFGLAWGWRLLYRSERGRYAIDHLLLRLPIVGGFQRNLALARFARNFAMLFASGIDILRVLALLQRVVGNSVLAAEVAAARQRIVTGDTLAHAFADSPHFPPLLKRLIGVGEQAGSLDKSLAKAAEYLDKELPRALKRLFTLLEAAIIVVLGALIAISALAMLLPIFQIQSQLLK